MNDPFDRPTRNRSPFITEGEVPSTAMIDKLLRAVTEAPSTVLNEHTVDEFCSRLKESARLLSELRITADPVDRAESFHYLLLMMAYAVDASVLNADPLEPMWSQPYRLHLLDWGGASPDSVYRRVMVRDDLAYRVYGQIGNGKYFTIDCRQSSPACTIMIEDIEFDDDGNFEIFFGGEDRERNWFPLREGTTGLVVREFFDDWIAARRSHLRIECLNGGTAPRSEYRASRVAAEFDLVGDWILEGGVRYWAERSTTMASNLENAFGGKLYRAETKLPVTNFAWWELTSEEALIIELEDPQAEFWGMHVVTVFWRTLDYANRLTTYNCAQSHRDPDGVYRFVLCQQDPGYHNWLDTTGLHTGIVILRFCGATRAVPPRTKHVRLSQLAELLPDSPRCTAEQRRAQIAERREGVAHMVCD